MADSAKMTEVAVPEDGSTVYLQKSLTLPAETAALQNDNEQVSKFRVSSVTNQIKSKGKILRSAQNDNEIILAR